jgi:hypothetical protein
MVLEVPDFIGEEKRVRHELIIDREESLQSTDNNTEDVFLCKMVHERVSIEGTLAHFDYIKVMVAQGHSIPQYRPITWLIGFTISVFAYHILYCVKFSSAVVCIHYYLSAANLTLFFTIYQVVLVTRLIIIKVVYNLAVGVQHKVGSCTLRRLLGAILDLLLIRY